LIVGRQKSKAESFSRRLRTIPRRAIVRKATPTAARTGRNH